MRQALAVGILAIMALFVWKLVVWPLVNLSVSRQTDVETLSDQLRDLRNMERRAPLLGKREQTAIGKLKTLDVFWSGPSEAAITASMQDIIRNAAQQSGGIVTSSAILTQSAATQHGMLAIRARVDGPLDTLVRVLSTVEAARPKLFVGSLAVSFVSPGTRDRPPQLSFEFSVSGYVSGPSRAY